MVHEIYVVGEEGSKNKELWDFPPVERLYLEQHGSEMLSELGVAGHLINMTKNVYENTTANIILKGVKLNDFQLKLGTI